MPLKRRRFRIRYLLLAVIALAAAAAAATGAYLWLRGGDGEPIRVVTSVQIPYPEGWGEQPLTEADRNAGLLLKLDRERPEASFLARTVIARLAPDFDIDELAGDTEAALSAEIDNFDLISSSVLPIGPFDAVRIYYRQTGEEELAGHRVIMAIVPTPNQTFYLTFRAEERDFRRIEGEGLQIIDAFVNDVGARLQ
jgi:hypothetical protein